MFDVTVGGYAFSARSMNEISYLTPLFIIKLSETMTNEKTFFFFFGSKLFWALTKRDGVF